MERLNAWKEKTVINGKEYTITSIECGTVFDSYISAEHYPMMFMFGMPMDQTQANEPMVLTLSDAMKIAIANAPNYLYMYDED